MFHVMNPDFSIIHQRNKLWHGGYPIRIIVSCCSLLWRVDKCTITVRLIINLQKKCNFGEKLFFWRKWATNDHLKYYKYVGVGISATTLVVQIFNGKLFLISEHCDVIHRLSDLKKKSMSWNYQILYLEIIPVPCSDIQNILL